VTAWLDQLSSARVRTDHRLCAARAWLTLDRGELDGVDPWLTAADAAIRAEEADGAEPPDLAALRDLAVLRSVHRFKIGDVGASRAAALRVLELSASEIGFATTVAQLMIGITAHWRGQPAVGRRALAEAVRHARHTGNRLATAYALAYLALGAVDGGALEEASRAVPVALDAAEEPNMAEHFVAVIPHLAAALHAASGRTEGAAQRGAGRLELAVALASWAQAEAVMGCDTQRELEHTPAIARACADPGEVVQRLSASAYRARLPTTTVERRPTPRWAPVSANCCRSWPAPCRNTARRSLARREQAALTRIRISQVLNSARWLKPSMPRRTAIQVSWTTSSASSDPT